MSKCIFTKMNSTHVLSHARAHACTHTHTHSNTLTHSHRLDSPGQRNTGGLEVLVGDNESSPISDMLDTSRTGDGSLDGSLVEELLFDDS